MRPAVLFGLWLRQVKRYLRSRARIIGSLGQPLLFLVALGFGLGAVFRRAGQGDYLKFLAPGVMAMSILFTAIFSGVEIIWDRQFGFLKEMLVAPVPRLAIMFGRTLGGATVATVQGLIVFIIALFFGFRPTHLPRLPWALLIMLLISLLFTALGTAIASVVEDFQGFQLIMNLLVMPLFFFSGAIYPLQGLPRALVIITKANPLSYGVDALRTSFGSATEFGMTLDIAVLAGVTLLLLIAGAALFNRIEA
ncbi:MAG TPA: ABC transporter permease [Thermoanaerobaculia bacterium]|nr:ABC transporter permease [Thermoanaerobaculia bacterium]